MPGDLPGAHAPFAALRSLDGQQAHAGGEHAAVHHIDALQLRGRQPGGVEGVGQLRADVQVHDLKALGRQRAEEIQKLLHAGGGGLGQQSVLMVAAVHVQRRKAHAVVHKVVLSQGDHQGDDPDVEALLQLRRQIHRAVRRDQNRLVHKGMHTSPFCFVG